ncbi:MAG: VWA domain-containing protein, partial [Planctomycetes bacterium]|nr:VWA domain-containing protein [Planctomycetota bacterium]
GRPRQMDFPALRFVRQSHLASAGRTRLKRWLLLALRAAMLGAFVLVLARPVDQSNVVAAYQHVPAAAVFCFDTSASMQYRHLGRSRLEMAQQLASRILAGLPPGSRTAVLSLTTDPAAVALSDDAGQAADDIRRLAPTSRSEPVAGMLRAAERLLERVGEDRREIYLFTDMAEGAWRGLDDGALAGYERVPVYVLDVAADDNQNVALGPLDLSSRRVSVNAALSITASVSCAERPADRTVVLEIDGQVRERQAVQLERPQSVQAVTFSYQAASKGLLQGSVSLLEADPLVPDNQRFFTVEVADPPAVAVVYGGARTPRPGDAAFAVDQALAPAPLRVEGRASVAPELLPVGELASASLGGYEAVFLVDAPGVTAEGWRALDDFVVRGGGLVVVAGADMAAELVAGGSTYNAPATRRLLGLRFAKVQRMPQGAHVEPPDYGDEALSGFDGGSGGDLTAPAIYRRIGLEPEQGSRTILKVDGQPLLVAAGYGQGNVLVLGTGPQSDWSALGSFRHANEFVVLLSSLLGQAARQTGRAGQYGIGSPITFAFPRSMGGMDCVLSGPGLESGLTRRIDRQTATASLPALERPGNYLLRVDMPTGPRQLGFSLNVDREESALKVRSAASVEKIFPKGLLHVSRDLDGLQYAETLVRRGRERTAQLVPILMAIMVLELLIANRFYRGSAALGGPPKPAS